MRAGFTAVQRAWLETDVAQCGYCQSGQIMVATALLKEEPCTRQMQQIDTAMAGNVCRCGTYPRIRKAVHLAATLIADGGDAYESFIDDRRDSADGSLLQAGGAFLFAAECPITFARKANAAGGGR